MAEVVEQEQEKELGRRRGLVLNTHFIQRRGETFVSLRLFPFVGLLCLWGALWGSACSNGSGSEGTSSEAATPATVEEAQGRAVSKTTGEFGGTPFTAVLYPAIEDPERREFDGLAWKRKWDVAGTLYILKISASEAPENGAYEALDLSGLALVAQEDGQETLLSFIDPGEFSGDPIVRDPLAVLLSAPGEPLSPGASLSVAFLGPDRLTDPFLALGEARFELTPTDDQSARLPRELPLLHFTLEENSKDTPE